MSDQEADAALAREAVDRLTGTTPGLTLVGPVARTERVIRLLCDRLDPALLSPVRLDLDGTTPAQLRSAVQRAHSDRISPETSLLLILSRASLLSPAMMDELEMAADAAASFGGLRFLLAAEPPGPAPGLGGLPSLGAAVATRLVVHPAAVPPGHRPGPRLPLTQPRTRPSRAPRIAGRVVLAAAVLAGLVLAAALVLRGVRTGTPPLPAGGGVITPAQRPVPPAPVPPPPAGPAAPPASPASAAVPPPTQTPVRAPMQPGGDAIVPETAPPVAPPQAASLLLMAQPGDTLELLYAKVYAGVATPPPFEQVRTLNPIVRPGTRLVFPPPPTGWPSR